jgi:hypothetical protein
MLYKKLDINCSHLEISKLKGNKKNNYGPTFLEYDILDWNYLKDFVVKNFILKIRPDRINVTDIVDHGADVHTDHWPVALNFYLTTTGDTTKYFKVKGVNGTQVREVKVYNLEDLEEVDSFVANTGDCYLIDTHSPHSVLHEGERKIRTILRFTWFNKTIDEIADSIKIR